MSRPLEVLKKNREYVFDAIRREETRLQQMETNHANDVSNAMSFINTENKALKEYDKAIRILEKQGLK